jgi:acyl-homoserine lactone synthase
MRLSTQASVGAFMIEIVHSGNARRFQDLLDSQFRLRHEVFVRERGWSRFDVDGVREKDQYDNDNAVYLIAADHAGGVAGGFRLYPTALPHMLSEHFPQLVDSTIIERSDVLELTRFGMRRSERRSRHYFELLLAIQEYGLMEGLSGFTSVINPLRIPILQGFGFEVEPLGLPTMIDGEATIAVLFHVSEACFARVRDAVAIHECVLHDSTQPVPLTSRRIA